MRPIHLIALGLLLASPCAAGPLNPPAGPVSPTQATLITALPFTISAPGHYRLAASLTATAANHRIAINSGAVTLDLAGLTLSGDGIANNLINITAGQGITIRNGTMRDTLRSIVFAAATATDITIEDLTLLDSANENALALANSSAVVRRVTISNTGLNGIAAGPNSTIEDCNIANAGADGVQLTSGTLRNTTSTNNAGAGFLIAGNAAITHCTADNNGDSGFITGPTTTLTHCIAAANGASPLALTPPDATQPANPPTAAAPSTDTGTTRTTNALAPALPLSPASLDAQALRALVAQRRAPTSPRDNLPVTGLTAPTRGAAAPGFSIGQACTLENCVATANAGDGFTIALDAVVRGCSAVANSGSGFFADRSAFTQSAANANALSGFVLVAEASVDACEARGNTLNGIEAGLAVTIVNNRVSANGASGIVVVNSGNRVDSNHTAENASGFGIVLQAPFNLCVRNHLEVDIINAVANNLVGGLNNLNTPFANFAF